MSDYTSSRVLICLVSALSEETARNFHDAYRSGNAEAHFVDLFLAEAIEAGLVDAEDHTDSVAWQDAVEEVYGEPEDDDDGEED